MAEEVAGNDKIDPDYPPNMASEDFSFMLQKKPGAYVFIGNGPEDDGRILHNPHTTSTTRSCRSGHPTGRAWSKRRWPGDPLGRSAAGGPP